MRLLRQATKACAKSIAVKSFQGALPYTLTSSPAFCSALNMLPLLDLPTHDLAVQGASGSVPRSLDTLGVMAGDLDFEVEEGVRDELDLWVFP